MREKKPFGIRSAPSCSREPLKKFILLMEGEKTEPLYFQALEDNRDAVGISPLITITQMQRTITEAGWSNPLKILKEIIRKTEEETKKITYKTLIDCVIATLEQDSTDMTDAFLKFVFITLKNMYAEKGQDLSKTVANLDAEIANIKKEFSCWEDFGIRIEKYIAYAIEDQALAYEKGHDKICLIVDRDKKSFTQFDEVLKLCKKHGIGFYLTNPCFEFFLLLHTPTVTSLDKTQLLENEDKFIIKQLRAQLGAYRKNEFDTDYFMNNIDIAITNEKSYCENIENLKDNLGSNVATLITEMRQKTT